MLRQILEASATAELQFQQQLPQSSLQVEIRPQPHQTQSSRSPTKLIDQSLKTLSSSASKPPPSHPILKKARGPSNSGPRPTARFISPQESAEEDEFSSSGSTIATGLETRAPVASSSKKTHTPVKKFVAVTTSAKRRPVLSRRQSSQSTITGETTSREASSSSALRRAATHNSKQSPSQETLGSEDSSSSVLPERPSISAKAAGKRPALQRRTTSEKKHSLKQENRSSVVPLRSPPVEQAKVAALAQARSMVDLPGHSRAGSGASVTSGNAVEANPAAVMARAQSHTGYGRRRETSIGRAPVQGLFTGATASTTNVAAQGMILDQSGLGSMPLPSMLDRHRDSHNMSDQSPTSSVLDSKFTPTPPTTSASVPLGRTKSQLTLLLERENAKIGHKSLSRS